MTERNPEEPTDASIAVAFALLRHGSALPWIPPDEPPVFGSFEEIPPLKDDNSKPAKSPANQPKASPIRATDSQGNTVEIADSFLDLAGNPTLVRSRAEPNTRRTIPNNSINGYNNTINNNINNISVPNRKVEPTNIRNIRRTLVNASGPDCVYSSVLCTEEEARAIVRKHNLVETNQGGHYQASVSGLGQLQAWISPASLKKTGESRVCIARGATGTDYLNLIDEAMHHTVNVAGDMQTLTADALAELDVQRIRHYNQILQDPAITQETYQFSRFLEGLNNSLVDLDEWKDAQSHFDSWEDARSEASLSLEDVVSAPSDIREDTLGSVGVLENAPIMPPILRTFTGSSLPSSYRNARQGEVTQLTGPKLDQKVRPEPLSNRVCKGIKTPAGIHMSSFLCDTGCHSGRHINGHTLIARAYAQFIQILICQVKGLFETTYFGSATSPPETNPLEYACLDIIVTGRTSDGKWCSVRDNAHYGEREIPGSNRTILCSVWGDFLLDKRHSEVSGLADRTSKGLVAQVVPWLFPRDTVILGESSLLSVGYSPYGHKQNLWGSYLFEKLASSTGEISLYVPRLPHFIHNREYHPSLIGKCEESKSTDSKIPEDEKSKFEGHYEQYDPAGPIQVGSYRRSNTTFDMYRTAEEETILGSHFRCGPTHA